MYRHVHDALIYFPQPLVLRGWGDMLNKPSQTTVVCLGFLDDTMHLNPWLAVKVWQVTHGSMKSQEFSHQQS